MPVKDLTVRLLKTQGTPIAFIYFHIQYKKGPVSNKITVNKSSLVMNLSLKVMSMSMSEKASYHMC